MVQKYLYGTNIAETIEVSNEQIAAGLPVLLQVRRGSESALNQLLPDAGVNDGNTSGSSRCSSGYTKRWSAAAPLSQEPKERYTPKKDSDFITNNSHFKQKKLTFAEEDENEERDVFVPRCKSSAFTRDGSNRLSMQFYGDQPGGQKWADAADRMMNNRVFSLSLPREHRKKEPLGQANSNSVPSTVNEFDSSECIVLKMDDEALGIHVVPDYDQNGNDRGLLVQKIDPGGKVDRDGRLSVNDRIVEINDRNLLNQSLNTVQEIFRDSLRSPELKLRVIKHQHHSGMTRPVNGVTKKQPPPPVYPKPSVNHPKHPMHNKENVAMVKSEEKNVVSSSKVATVSPTKKVQSLPHIGSNVLMAVNTRKIGRIIEVELTKGPENFGFSVTTRDNPIGGNYPIYIKNILPKGAAVEDGRLKCGDRLLSINGVDLTGKTKDDAVAELRNVPMGRKVKIVVSRQEDVHSRTESGNDNMEVPVGGGASSTYNTPAKNVQNVQNVPDIDVVDSGKKPASQGVDQSSIFPWRQREILTFDVPVHDTEKAGLGISVKGKTSTNTSQKQGDKDISVDMGIFINSVINGGAASRDGRLRTNDQLLNVNGVSLLGLSNTDAMDTLKRAIYTEGPKPGTITLTVARKIGNLSNHQKQRRDSSSSLLTDSSASTETFGRSDQDNTAPTSTDNSGNSEQSDNTVIFLPSSKAQSKCPPDLISSRNPVLDRLTGQLPSHNALRNESYYRATHQTTIMLMGKDVDRLTSPTVNQSPGDLVIIEEDPPYSPTSENSIEPQSTGGQQRGSTSTHGTDVTYASQLSLDDGGGFSRDAFGRQSMSEKRHATLDAKSTDTYKRNKKVREEREKQRIHENRRSTIGVVKVNSTESIPRSDRNDVNAKSQLGPSLGMKKSSSLESLQTMVQEIQMAEDGIYRRAQVPVKVIRGRGCNESFRAAVDRSYEAPSHHVMESVPEDDGCHFPPRQSSLNSQLDCKLMKQQQNNHKKKSSLLKGLGSMFRFGRHRKPAILEEAASSHLGISSKNAEEEKERARKAARDEQQRIQEQYKILLQRQMDMQQQQQLPQQSPSQQSQQQQQNSHMQRMHNATQYIQANNININNNYVPMGNCNELKQMRAQQQQYRYVDRRSLFPPETKEEYYNGVMRQSMRHTEGRHSEGRHTETDPSFNHANRSSEKYVSSPESNRYSHYVNYEEIQQHLNRKQQHYHSQRRDNRDLSHRPVSNFYEYESVQTMMQNHGVHPSRQPYVDANMNTAVRNEFFPVSVYGSTRNRSSQEHRQYQMYQNSNSPYQKQFSPSQKQFFYPPAPLYSNIRPLSKAQGPYVTQVTIRDNHHHYTNNSLGTKV